MLRAHFRNWHALVLWVLEAITLEVCGIQTVLVQLGDFIDVKLLLTGGCGRDHILQPLVIHGLPIQIWLACLTLR